MTRQQKAGIFITILVLILAVSFPVNAATIKSKSICHRGKVSNEYCRICGGIFCKSKKPAY